MLVKIKDNYINVYEWNFKYKFELRGCMEPDECYLALNDSSQYIYVYGYDDEEYIFTIPQRKIRRELRKLYKNLQEEDVEDEIPGDPDDFSSYSDINDDASISMEEDDEYSAFYDS